MKRSVILLFAFVFGFLAVLPTDPAGGPNGCRPVWAALEEIRFLPRVTVNRKQVFLSDICDPEGVPTEWKQAMAKTSIGDAPSAGSEKYIDPGLLRSYVTRFLEANGFEGSGIKLEIPDRITIVRESVQITQEQIETIFKKYVFDNSPWKQQDMTIQRVTFTGFPSIPAGEMTYEVVPQARERFLGAVSVYVSFFVEGEKARTLGVTGKVDVFQDVCHASRSIRQNGVIEPADIEVQRVNISDSPDRYAFRTDQVLGKRTMKNLGIHQAIELKDLDKPFLLRRGDPVTIVFDLPGLSLTAKGQVNADGGLGDNVPVVNVASKKTVYCRVVDNRTVRAAQ